MRLSLNGSTPRAAAMPVSLTPVAPVDARPEIDSQSLLRGARELIIRHGDQEYRLRRTQNDKLILTK